MRRFRVVGTVTAMLTAVVLAACGGGGGGSNPLANSSSGASSPGGGGAVVVGSANFSESAILAEIYAQAMKAKGVDASTKLNIGSREVYIKALKDNSIDVVPEYTGNLLLYFDKNATATTEAEIEQALPKATGPELKIGTVSKAQDQDVYVVTKQFADANQLTSLDDLKKVASSSILGGPSELADRAYGPPGLEKIYGAKFKQFKPYDSPAVKLKDLLDNKIQVASFFTTQSAIPDNNLVKLADPQSMILPQNVVPLMRADVAGNAEAMAAIDAVQAALTTEELTALDKKVDSEHQDPPQVAGDWLKAKGLA